MRRTAAVTGYAVLVAAVLLAPSLVLAGATARGGAAQAAGSDVVVISALVAFPCAFLAARRLRRPVGPGEREADRWLSSLHGLVVLALTASALPAVVLHETTLLQARVVDREWPVLLMWAVLLVLAVLASEAVRRLSARWLAGERRGSSAPARPASAGASQGVRKIAARPRG